MPDSDLSERFRSWNQSLWKGIELITSAQWHFDSLVDWKEHDPVRRVIHKTCLHRNTRQYKDEVMKVSPLCNALDSKHESSKRRQFDRYLQQGAVFDKLYSLCPGLMGLIAPTLTMPEYGRRRRF